MDETAAKPLVYLILGAAGSGRRVVLHDLIEGGLDEEDRSVVLWSGGESGQPPEEKSAKVERWQWLNGSVEVDPSVLAGATHVFFVTDGTQNPVDQIEAFKSWLEMSGGELARVLCLVNCRLAEAHREVIAWYEACIHFSDVVILTERDGVANKWLSDFQTRFKGQFYPCLFEMLKDGRVKNPPLVLEPQARRMSHLFDEQEWVVAGGEDEDADADESEDGEEVEMVPETDPYLERRAGGRRVKELPDIAAFLPAKNA